MRKRREETKRTKLLLFANLFLLFMLLAIPTYAYWAGTVKGTTGSKDENIIIGTAGEVETTVGVELGSKTTGALVPEDRATTGQVEEVTIVYNITWVDTTNSADGTLGTLEVLADNILIGGAATYSSLVNITVLPTSTNITLNDGAVSITITVTLTEPADKTEYDAVAGKTIKFDLTFTVTPK